MRLLLLFICLLSAVWAQDSIVDLTILHFNDFHARLLPNAQGFGGAAYLASAIQQERKNCPRCLLLSAGDNVQGTPVSTIYRGLPVFEVLQPFKIDASVLGNHEFDYGYERINDFLAAAGHPLLAANFLTQDGKVFTGASSVIIERDNLRIGIVGVLMENLVPSFTTPAKLGPNKMLAALSTLRSEAAKLKDKTDILIALVHLTREDCDRIVTELPEYAITISGHDHGGKEIMFRAEDRVGVRLRSYGVEMGRLNLRYDKASRKIVNADWKRIPISSTVYQPDRVVAQLVEKWESKVRLVVDMKIGEGSSKKDRLQTKVWIEQVMRDKTGAQFAYISTGSVRDNLPAGQILARDIWNISPFDNMLVRANVPGRLIPEWIRGTTQLEPNKLYGIATIDFLVEGWRNSKDEALRIFGRALPLEGPFLRDALIEWIQTRRTVE